MKAHTPYSYSGHWSRPHGDYVMKFNEKNCWESFDTHTECLDRHNEVYDNHQRCPSTYQSWAQHCPDIIRRQQMIQRVQDKQDYLLYGDASANLKEYNRQKDAEPVYAEVRRPDFLPWTTK